MTDSNEEDEVDKVESPGARMTHSPPSQTSIILPTEGNKGPKEDDGKRNHRDPETPSCASQGVYDWMIFSGNGITVHLAILLRSPNPLDAEVTLLGDSLSPAENIRIEPLLILWGPGRGMPVEISDRVWAIGDTHPHPDASWIDLGHNPFRVKVSGCHRTDFRTRWMITVHARHGKEVHLHMGIGSFDFGDQVHPEFCPPQLGLLLSCKGDVILLTASHHTGLTPCAFIKINHHSP